MASSASGAVVATTGGIGAAGAAGVTVVDFVAGGATGAGWGTTGSLLTVTASTAASAAVFVSLRAAVSALTGVAAATGAGSGNGGFSAIGAGVGVSTGLAISAGGVSTGDKTATWSFVVGPVIASVGPAGAAATLGRSAGFALTGSTRKVASIASVVSGRWANGTSGVACQDELLAKDSWAARNSAAAPSPKMRSDIDNMIAAKRKRKPGSMARGILRKAVADGNAVATEVGFCQLSLIRKSARRMRALKIKTTGEADLSRAGVAVLTFLSHRNGFVDRMSEPRGHQKNSILVWFLTFAIKNSRQR